MAGLRKGLKHEETGDEETTRSGLFMDQLRIVKEMRRNDETRNGRTDLDVRPRWMVWENVPGAFSSNGGKDFQIVLTEIVRVVEPDAPPVPLPKDGRWPKAGCLYGVDGKWSIAYRLHDAQYWGVPQRRKRLCLVADFNGLGAQEVLFDPQLGRNATRPESHEAVPDPAAGRRSEVPSVGESLSGHPEPGEEAGQGTSPGSAESSDGTGCGAGRDGGNGGRGSLTPEAYGMSPMDSYGMKSDNPHSGFYRADTSRTLDLNGGNPACNQGGLAVVGYAVDCRNCCESPFVNGTLQAKEQGMNLNSNNVVRVPDQKGGS